MCAYILSSPLLISHAFKHDNANLKKYLFDMINDLPTILEVVTHDAKYKQAIALLLDIVSMFLFFKGKKEYPLVLHDGYDEFAVTSIRCLFTAAMRECQGPNQMMRPSMRDRMKRARDQTKRMKTNMRKPCADHVVNITTPMNSVFAVTYARDGSMGGASISHLLRRSTSLSSNVQPVRTREPGLDARLPMLLTSNIYSWRCFVPNLAHSFVCILFTHCCVVSIYDSFAMYDNPM
ncbi:hypothetical protein SASPL_129313 [Salvia splendens]|uniref:Uncharacterized protein n=1 Tax=Salvia splendens TaxID=180675 RepID=A0A8X8XCW5_SALSN|nr:hypothetical protein SASPL_129313 [Salvia splendens]